jgi:hypothetical protein
MDKTGHPGRTAGAKSSTRSDGKYMRDYGRYFDYTWEEERTELDKGYAEGVDLRTPEETSGGRIVDMAGSSQSLMDQKRILLMKMSGNGLL